MSGGAKVAAALVAAKKEIGNVKRTKQGQVGNSKYKYAELAAVIDEIDEALANHGMCHLQPAQQTDDGVLIVTTILHESGESISDGGMKIPLYPGQKTLNDGSVVTLPVTAQQVGSAVAYARRYGLMSLFGIAQEDDDGAAASKAPPRSAPAPAPATPPKYMTSDQRTSLLKKIKALPAEHEDTIMLRLNEKGIEWEKLTLSQGQSINKHIDTLRTESDE